VESLVSRRFAVISESSRIREIHEQDSSLQLLVLVVGLGVFLFGILTVLSVLIDSTDRKRGVIGILRVMGVSREGIFVLVLLRAAAIGILAGVVAAAAGWAIGQALAWQPPANSVFAAWKPDISIHIHPYDVALVMIGAVACAAIGAIVPAWKAAKLDPFDAIVEGRFT
jgi:ABC-type antimicrobial peptide transport system permease subunit